jgi:hypothetical protein
MRSSRVRPLQAARPTHPTGLRQLGPSPRQTRRDRSNSNRGEAFLVKNSRVPTTGLCDVNARAMEAARRVRYDAPAVGVVARLDEFLSSALRESPSASYVISSYGQSNRAARRPSAPRDRFRPSHRRPPRQLRTTHLRRLERNPITLRRSLRRRRGFGFPAE